MIRKCGKPLLTAVFFAAVFVFWAFAYPQALSYQEQFQLFLCDGEFFCQHLAVPAGLARYIAEFIVQFYNNVIFGALLIALVYVVIQLLCWRLIRRRNFMNMTIDGWYPISFLPSIVLWYLMGDQNVMLTYAVALVIVLLAMVFTPEDKKRRLWYSVVMIPVLYWTAGPAVFMFVAYIAILMILADRSLAAAGIVAALVIFSLLLVVGSSYIVPYPLGRLFQGVGYYRFPEVVPLVMWGLMFVIVALPYCIPPVGGHVAYTMFSLSVCTFLTAYWLVPAGFDDRTYELMDYDYLVRTGHWDDIIKKAEADKPDLPMSVAATNLALAMKDELGEKAFSFYQRGHKGLLPPFERNFSSLLVTAEAYFQLGLVNTAQRFSFEAMECLPDYNKSGRIIKRLAETNLISGDYAVARKYLMILQKTVFYSKWADRTMKLLGDEQAINRHPLYGKIRRQMPSDDVLFSEGEVDKILGQLFMKDKSNRMAMQYMLLWPLLDKDVDTFMRYLYVVQQHTAYNSTICQEASAFAYSQIKQTPPQGAVSPMVMQRFSAFAQAYSSGGADSPALESFRNTTWYYLIKGGK